MGHERSWRESLGSLWFPAAESCGPSVNASTDRQTRRGGSTRARIQLRRLAAVMLVACIVTPVFNVLTNQATLRSAIQGVVDGIGVPVLVGSYLIFVRDGWLRD
jgi:hypothetical protein